MFLSDGSIHRRLQLATKQRLVIKNLREGAVQPASVDLTLNRNLLVFESHGLPFVDPVTSDLSKLTRPVQMDAGTPFILRSGELVLAASNELFEFPHDLAGCLEGKSGLARLGLIVHSAGLFDPGFQGVATLELSNQSRLPIALRPGMWIAQMCFVQMSDFVQIPYGSAALKSHYQASDGEGPRPPTNLKGAPPIDL